MASLVLTRFSAYLPSFPSGLCTVLFSGGNNASPCTSGSYTTTQNRNRVQTRVYQSCPTRQYFFSNHFIVHTRLFSTISRRLVEKKPPSSERRTKSNGCSQLAVSRQCSNGGICDLKNQNLSPVLDYDQTGDNGSFFAEYLGYDCISLTTFYDELDGMYRKFNGVKYGEKDKRVSLPSNWEPRFSVNIANDDETAKEYERTCSADVKIFTDGSATSLGVGAAAVVERKGMPTKLLKFRVGKYTDHTSNDAEAAGLVLAVWLAKQEKDINSAEFHSQMDDLFACFPKLDLQIHWVPGHSGVSGNNAVDYAAKFAAKGRPDPHSQVFIPTTLPSAANQSPITPKVKHNAVADSAKICHAMMLSSSPRK
ncbi:hypothetical protein C8Q75DRAFT_602241 [Abortiporus biennis]|nr:hypothetical protein C8Q75DRAFT_602241 [Abortiporus biennis]